MKIIQFVLLFLLTFFFSHRIAGQSLPYVQGQILVRLDDQTSPFDLVAKLQTTPTGKDLRISKQISKHLNIWLLEIPKNSRQDIYILDLLRRQPEVMNAQFNHLLEYRSQPPAMLPNDPLFSQQWQHINTGAGGSTPNADFDSDLAWNISTGGLSADGDTIVVAVIDGGIDYLHEDLTTNLWRNYQEIPGDEIDNDGNGYIDDFRGWNVYADNDDISGLATGHGTPVSAIIAAKGDNGIGVTGINWNIKLMFVAGNNEEAAILEAYDYVLEARKRFNATQGQEGAFVVAANSSWGINYGQPADAPLWCAVFDSLGAAGILSVAATANIGLDVDTAGDLPTACPSDYLIAVTNLNKWDQKPTNAAWGAQTIDLGAYGKDVFTAGPNNSYGTFSGTSFAAPQVSGAIGLLYAVPCNNLITMAKSNPAFAALQIKNALLNSATPNNAMENITVSGGRLNCNNLLNYYENNCVDCLAPFAISGQAINEMTIHLYWSQVPGMQNINLRWRKAGAPSWTLVTNAFSPQELSSLEKCTLYEFSLRSDCGTGNWSAWSNPVAIKTLGCCTPPAFIGTTLIGDTVANLSWSNSPAAIRYKISVRPSGGPWKEYFSNTNHLFLDTLLSCTRYETATQSICGKDSISVPVFYNFNTSGCGVCTDDMYCTANATFTEDEWISAVEIGSWSNYSDGGPGYQDFTSTPLEQPDILPNKSVPVTIKPGFSGAPYKEYFRVYIDYNADGDFDDPDELAFDPGFASDVPVSGFIVTPSTIAWGPTRMRVMMKYKSLQALPPTACEIFDFGQVEDYCVHLGASVITSQGKSAPQKLFVFPQPARDFAWLRLPQGLTYPVTLTILDAAAREHYREIRSQQESSLALNTANLPTGMYLIRVQSASTILHQKLFVVR